MGIPKRPINPYGLLGVALRLTVSIGDAWAFKALSPEQKIVNEQTTHIMNQSKIENVQPEEKLNNEQKVDNSRSAQVSANAFVGGSFVCQGCGHELINDFCMKTAGYCYLCDPNITLDELLK